MTMMKGGGGRHAKKEEMTHTHNHNEESLMMKMMNQLKSMTPGRINETMGEGQDEEEEGREWGNNPENRGKMTARDDTVRRRGNTARG